MHVDLGSLGSRKGYGKMKLRLFGTFGTSTLLLLSSCGGGDDNGNSSIVLSEYLMPPVSISYTENEYRYSNGVRGQDDATNVKMERNGDVLTVFYDDVANYSITEFADKLVVEDLGDENNSPILNVNGEEEKYIVEYPLETSVGQAVVASFTFFDEPITLTETFVRLHDSYSIETPLGTFASYNNVLQIDRIMQNSDEYDLSSAYFAKGIGEIGRVDKDCLIDIFVRDEENDSECDAIEEAYTVRQ